MIHVGDNAVDIEAVRRAGLSSVVVKWGCAPVPNLSSSTPDIFIAAPEILLESDHPAGRGYIGEALIGECAFHPPWGVGAAVYALGCYYAASDPRHDGSALSAAILALRSDDRPAPRLGDIVGSAITRGLEAGLCGAGADEAVAEPHRLWRPVRGCANAYACGHHGLPRGSLLHKGHRRLQADREEGSHQGAQIRILRPTGRERSNDPGSGRCLHHRRNSERMCARSPPEGRRGPRHGNSADPEGVAYEKSAPRAGG